MNNFHCAQTNSSKDNPGRISEARMNLETFDESLNFTYG